MREKPLERVLSDHGNSENAITIGLRCRVHVEVLDSDEASHGCCCLPAALPPSILRRDQAAGLRVTCAGHRADRRMHRNIADCETRTGRGSRCNGAAHVDRVRNRSGLRISSGVKDAACGSTDQRFLAETAQKANLRAVVPRLQARMSVDADLVERGHPMQILNNGSCTGRPSSQHGPAAQQLD